MNTMNTMSTLGVSQCPITRWVIFPSTTTDAFLNPVENLVTWMSPVQTQKGWSRDRTMERSAKLVWEAAKAASVFHSPVKKAYFLSCQTCGICIGPGYDQDQAYVRHVYKQHAHDANDNYLYCKNAFFVCCGSCAARHHVPDASMLFDRTLWETPIILKDVSHDDPDMDIHMYDGNSNILPMDWFNPEVYSEEDHKRAISEYLFFLYMVVFPHFRRRFNVAKYPTLLQTVLHILVNHWVGMKYKVKHFARVTVPAARQHQLAAPVVPASGHVTTVQPENKRSLSLHHGVRLHRPTTMSIPATVQHATIAS